MSSSAQRKKPAIPLSSDNRAAAAEAMKVGEAEASTSTIITLEDWKERGTALGQTRTDSMWALGDWLRSAESSWGDKYVMAVALTDYEVGTLRNANSVAEKFADLSRRRYKVHFSFHAAVASLPPEEADRLLEECQTKGLTRAELRRRVDEIRNPQPQSTEPEPPTKPTPKPRAKESHQPYSHHSKKTTNGTPPRPEDQNQLKVEAAFTVLCDVVEKLVSFQTYNVSIGEIGKFISAGTGSSERVEELHQLAHGRRDDLVHIFYEFLTEIERV